MSNTLKLGVACMIMGACLIVAAVAIIDGIAPAIMAAGFLTILGGGMTAISQA